MEQSGRVKVSKAQQALLGKIYRYLTQQQGIKKEFIQNQFAHPHIQSRVFNNSYTLARAMLTHLRERQAKLAHETKGNTEESFPRNEGGELRIKNSNILKEQLAHSPGLKLANANTSEDNSNSLVEIHEKVQACKACFIAELRGKASPPPLRAQPKSNGRIIVVIDQVSYYSQTVKEYFMDSAGEMLKKILAALNIDLNHTYYTSLLKCTGTVEISDRLAEAKTCLTHFYEELLYFKPQLLLVFGLNSYRLLFSPSQNSAEFLPAFHAARGKIVRYTSPNNISANCLFTHSPQEVVRDTGLKREVWNDLKPHLKTIDFLLKP